MPKTHRPFIRSTLVIVLGLAIAACNPSKAPPPPPGGGVVTVKQEDQFGMAFATAFRAANNSEPYSPQDGDIVAVSLSAEPVTIK